MGNYTWNIDTLMKKKDLIEQLISVEKNHEKLELLQRDYEVLQGYIDEQNEDLSYDRMSLLESYDYIKESLETIKFLWPKIRKFNSIVNKPLNSPEFRKNSLSKNDLLTITHDFYNKSLNKYFFTYFLKNFRMRNNHVAFRRYNNENICGETITLTSLKESFIEIYREYNNEDILTTIHEYSHATSLSINPYQLNSDKSLFIEIDTIFMELVAADYISNLFKDKSNVIFNAKKINEYYDTAEELVIMMNTINGEKYTEDGYKNNKMLKNIALTHYNIHPEIINEVIGAPNLHSTIYLNSYMFALELFKLYKEDKEKALYTLKKIILLNDMSELEYYCSILKLGLIPNFNLANHYKEVKKESLKLTRKK